MRVIVLGATGHIGSYLVPRLVAAGHDVVAVSRGTRDPYVPSTAWERVERVVADREAEDASGTFGGRIAALNADAVIDLVCFTPASAAQLVEALRGRDVHLLHCGTIWTHGLSAISPLREDDDKAPFGDYGTQKAEIERMLLAETRAGGVTSTVIHPGHISGPGWHVINPQGNLDPAVWRALATGGEVLVPGLGAETMHHVHADDVAQVFERALDRPEASIGRSFHAVSGRALTVRGFATAAAGWFGREPNLRHVSWEEFRASVPEEHAGASWEHICRSHSASIDAAREALGYAPAFTSLDATREALAWLAAAGEVDLDGQTTAA
jgi:nucleoside-diphosphate-sugar epimerase